MKPFDLQQLKEIFRDDRLHMALAVVKSLDFSADRSVLRCMVQMLPEGINMVARMSWDAVGPDAGMFQFPSANDLVLISFANGHEDECYIIRRLTSKEDKIPVQAADGHLVMRALAGKKAYVQSTLKINLSKTGEGAEQNMMGNTFRDAYSEHLQIDSEHYHIGNLGYFTQPPFQAQEYLDIKASPVDDGLMLSDLVHLDK